MKLEERICACGCRKTFRCLPSSGTRYSSLHCMEAAGALPPVDKFGRGTKPPRVEAAATAPKVEVKAELQKAEAPVAKEAKVAKAAPKVTKPAAKKAKLERSSSRSKRSPEMNL